MMYIYMSLIMGSCWMLVLFSLESLNNFNFVDAGSAVTGGEASPEVQGLNQLVRTLADPSEHCLVVKDLDLW